MLQPLHRYERQSCLCDVSKLAAGQQGFVFDPFFRSDGGASFGKAQKLGEGSWKLNGCPMDGGGLAIDENGDVQTVWRRKNTILQQYQVSLKRR